MRTLGIETATPRGSVTLMEAGQSVCSFEHRRENAHGESIQPLIEQALAAAGWARTSLDRIAVGAGPGSFTGLRVGIALAKGIAEGLQIPLIGIGSLQAMAVAVPPDVRGLRCPVLDARHGELFVALYNESGVQLCAPRIAAGAEALVAMGNEHPDASLVYLGEAVPEALAAPRFRSPETDLPHARWTALAAEHAPVPDSVGALYVRHTVAVRPELPPNPLSLPRSGS